MNRSKILLLCLIIVVASVVGCKGGRKDSSPAVEIVFWTTDTEPDRLKTQQEIAARFMRKNPEIAVKVIPVQESELPKKIVAAKVSKTLPDVMRLGLEFVYGYADQGIVDSFAATEVIGAIGEDKFFSGALNLLRTSEGKFIAVPVDGWVQGIYYRKDWFERKDLPVPDTWEKILAAAEKLHRPSEGIYGIVAGTDPAQIYTQQVFENLALSAGVRLFDNDGNVAIVKSVDARRRMRSVLDFYQKLIDFSPPGNNYWRQAQQYYLTGRAAMIFYSNYIADDIAGLVEHGSQIDEKLAANTGFVPIIHQVEGDRGAGYGQIVTLAVSKTADSEAAKKWILYILSEEYSTLINMSPGGKIPMLKSVVEEWAEGKVFENYDPGFAATLAKSLEEIKRWGFVEGKYFSAVSEISGRKIFPKAIGKMAQGDLSPSEALNELVRRLELFNR